MIIIWYLLSLWYLGKFHSQWLMVRWCWYWSPLSFKLFTQLLKCPFHLPSWWRYKTLTVAPFYRRVHTVRSGRAAAGDTAPFFPQKDYPSALDEASLSLPFSFYTSRHPDDHLFLSLWVGSEQPWAILMQDRHLGLLLLTQIISLIGSASALPTLTLRVCSLRIFKQILICKLFGTAGLLCYTTFHSCKTLRGVSVSHHVFHGRSTAALELFRTSWSVQEPRQRSVPRVTRPGSR